MKNLTFLFLIFFSVIVLAQRRTRKHIILKSNGASTVKANIFSNEIVKTTIEESKDFIVLTSTGIPNHAIGKFPNSGNPHKVSPQQHIFKIPKKPEYKNKSTKLEMAFDFGVALNGIPFDPGAAEWFKGERNSKWQYEALSGAVRLGVDDNHAHVQPTGAYHYHGLPTLYLSKLGVQKGKISPRIGYAADGFSIYALYGKNGKELVSSYRLKKGTRPIGGEYDGTFVADYEFVKGSGDLDECNGKKMNGQYSYFLSRSFPIIPRCFKGTPHSSFRRGRNNNPRTNNHIHSSQGHLRGHGPPKEALKACVGKSIGSSCSFSTPRGLLKGTCFNPPLGGLACRR